MGNMLSKAEIMSYRAMVAVLAVSGVAQMPIFKRYRIADVPGLAWTADYAFTHWLHYLAAAVLLFWLGRLLADGGVKRLGSARAAILAILAVTGVVRVLKNLPDVSFSPLTTMLTDWVHLAAAMALGVAALIMFFKRRRR